MKVKISGKNIAVTDALKDYAQKKVGKIGKFFEGDVEAQVTINVEKDRHIVEVTIPVNGMILRGETETHDMYSSIDLVVEKIEKQIDKYKAKIGRNLRITPIKFLGDNLKDEEHPEVVKVKRFAIKPMDVEEAIMQMDLLGHDFFVFLNADTNETNVVYRRRDGKYGLIEPELD